ncbi:Sensor protein [Modestobacter italicus]|uniref:histidine kinase n=1 Tax=Modestobacter italicus (strain DSM 44449 / CECT 9708 / BC 501) TaxID=2732864 RepID=I4F480_MODI5|nr:HAMP domain-containing sensor histidine kinase [Modestobacter marinus]CCH90443.1 Sensor protein [Modestobacter marinus]
MTAQATSPPAADPGASAGELSSGPPSDTSASGRRTWGDRVPLRVTLVALLVALVTLALAATGGAATSLLRGYLAEQQEIALRTDAQYIVYKTRLAEVQCTSPSGLPYAGQGLYLACLDADGVYGELAPVGGSVPDLGNLTADEAAQKGGKTFIRRSEDGKTSWRLVVVQPDNGLTVVVGQDVGADQALLSRLIRTELAVGALVLAVMAIAGYMLVRNSLRPLREVEHTAQAIAAGDLSRRVPVADHRTEVGRLSAALNGMLGRIESSFRAQQASEEQARASETRMRRFVADASHELRTPLTSIRGFAELHRQGAVQGPEDTGRIMQRIEAEATRMGMLVEDLLQLARLDQQRPLTLGPVDLAELAGDAVHDARAVQPDRPLSLLLDPSLTDVPVVTGDEARLRQVVGNLVTNALTHTPVDARVTVRLSEDDADSVVLTVSDEGPGLAPADAERVFERFYRADSSRTRAAGGTGLGLSIVASLVAAHGGTVDLTTAPGQGATFTVRLPRSGPPIPPTAEPTPS